MCFLPVIHSLRCASLSFFLGTPSNFYCVSIYCYCCYTQVYLSSWEHPLTLAVSLFIGIAAVLQWKRALFNKVGIFYFTLSKLVFFASACFSVKSNIAFLVLSPLFAAEDGVYQGWANCFSRWPKIEKKMCGGIR